MAAKTGNAYIMIFPWISTEKSVDMDLDMDGKFHIHGKPAYYLSEVD